MFGFKVFGFGFRVLGFGFQVSVFGFRVLVRVPSFMLRVLCFGSGVGFRDSGLQAGGCPLLLAPGAHQCPQPRSALETRHAPSRARSVPSCGETWTLRASLDASPRASPRERPSAGGRLARDEQRWDEQRTPVTTKTTPADPNS